MNKKRLGLSLMSVLMGVIPVVPLLSVTNNSRSGGFSAATNSSLSASQGGRGSELDSSKTWGAVGEGVQSNASAAGSSWSDFFKTTAENFNKSLAVTQQSAVASVDQARDQVTYDAATYKAQLAQQQSEFQSKLTLLQQQYQQQLTLAMAQAQAQASGIQSQLTAQQQLILTSWQTSQQDMLLMMNATQQQAAYQAAYMLLQGGAIIYMPTAQMNDQQKAFYEEWKKHDGIAQAAQRDAYSKMTPTQQYAYLYNNRSYAETRLAQNLRFMLLNDLTPRELSQYDAAAETRQKIAIAAAKKAADQTPEEKALVARRDAVVTQMRQLESTGQGRMSQDALSSYASITKKRNAILFLIADQSVISLHYKYLIATEQAQYRAAVQGYILLQGFEYTPYDDLAPDVKSKYEAFVKTRTQLDASARGRMPDQAVRDQSTRMQAARDQHATAAQKALFFVPLVANSSASVVTPTTTTAATIVPVAPVASVATTAPVASTATSTTASTEASTAIIPVQSPAAQAVLSAQSGGGDVALVVPAATSTAPVSLQATTSSIYNSLYASQGQGASAAPVG